VGSSTKISGLLWVTLAYVLAGVASYIAIALGWVSGFSPVLGTWWLDVLATTVVFAFSTVFRNTSFYDAYWSVLPMAVAPAWWWMAVEGSDPLRGMMALVLVELWGVRLTLNWARGWTGLDHEDWRYVDLRNKTGAAFPLVNYFGLHFFPTVQVFLGLLPMALIYFEPNGPLGWLGAVGFLIGCVSVAIEWIADEQMRRFRATSKKGECMDKGLWAWSRHPNYLGEIGFWFGLALLGADVRWVWWGHVGWTAIAVMFVGISIPMMEKRQLASRPAFADVKKRVSFLLPWPPKSA